MQPRVQGRAARDAGRGPEAFYATALWLRGAFDGLAFEIHDVVAEGDLVVVHNTMSGRHTGVFTIYGPNGEVTQAMPPTGKPFATTQTHWMRVEDGKVIEHWANRDDQGTAMQLGWIPPSPWYLAKMALATRRARTRGQAAQRRVRSRPLQPEPEPGRPGARRDSRRPRTVRSQMPERRSSRPAGPTFHPP